MRSMSLVVDLIDLVTKHKSGELRCPATALILFKQVRKIKISVPQTKCRAYPIHSFIHSFIPSQSVSSG